MTQTLDLGHFRNGLLGLFEELFFESKDRVLDRNQSYLETLADVTAAEASIRISGQSGSIAAQVNHVSTFVAWLNTLVSTGEMTPLDWPGTWKANEVTGEEWQELMAKLRTEFENLRSFATTNENWDENFVAGAFQIVAHCGYHLGEIRQGLGVIRNPNPALARAA